MTAAQPSTAGHCQRCHAEVEHGDLRCAICGTQVPAASDPPAHNMQVEIMRCDGCGAAVSYDVQAKAPRCAFCASVMHVEKVEDPMEQTGWWGTLSVDRNQAHAALSQWLGGLGFLRPSDLSASATIEGLKPLWWVAWVFDATASVSWTADSNAGSRRSAWAPHAGKTELSFDRIVVGASRGLSHKETNALIPGHRLDLGSPQAPNIEGAIIEQFDVQRSEARGRILDTASAIATSRMQANHIPGSRYRNIKVELTLRGLRTRRCAFPAYVLAYRYRNKLYRAVINGQDQSFVVGKAPYSFWKILAIILGGLALAIGIAAALQSG
jgi:DNA-directed RNA polymerase subunit RPC12/RpoP